MDLSDEILQACLQRIEADKYGIRRKPDDRAMRYAVPDLCETQMTLRDVSISYLKFYERSKDP